MSKRLFKFIGRCRIIFCSFVRVYFLSSVTIAPLFWCFARVLTLWGTQIQDGIETFIFKALENITLKDRIILCKNRRIFVDKLFYLVRRLLHFNLKVPKMTQKSIETFKKNHSECPSKEKALFDSCLMAKLF